MAASKMKSPSPLLEPAEESSYEYHEIKDDDVGITFCSEMSIWL